MESKGVNKLPERHRKMWEVMERYCILILAVVKDYRDVSKLISLII